MVCLDADRLWGFDLWRFSRRKELERPRSCYRNDQPASEPPEKLLVALVTQEPPQAICAFEVALGSLGPRGKLGCISVGEANTLLFEPTDQSVHIILK